ncbi:MAG: ABC transporter permease [bacterium]|nr:ABC transporter permease [bacterium]
METFLRGIRVGLRRLRRAPGFSAAAILSLAVGIGANATIYSLLDSVFFQPLPIVEPERMVALFGQHEGNTGGYFKGFLPMSYPNYEDYRDRNEVFSDLVTWHGIWVGLSGGERPEQVLAEFISGSYFTMLGLKPHLGRFFTAAEDAPQGAHPVVVLGYGLWQRMGADPEVLGTTLTLNGQSLTVVGVAPPGYEGAHTIARMEAWIPNSMFTFIARPPLNELFEHRAGRFFFVIGRLKDGVSLEQAQANVDAIAEHLEAEYPERNKDRGVTVLSFYEALIHPGQSGAYEKAATFLAMVVGALLLIACGNVAGLLLARAWARRKETALQLSLGAGRGLLVRQLLTESALLALLGTLVAIPLAVVSLKALLLFRGPHFGERTLDPSLDLKVLAFTFALGLLTALLFGLIPALQATRPRVMGDLKKQTGESAQGGRFRLQDFFVVAQVALSLVALVGAGLFLRALATAQNIDPGFELHQMALVSFKPGTQGYDEVRARSFYRRVLEEGQSLPGVEAATLGEVPPLNVTIMRRVFPAGQGELSEDGAPVMTSIVGADYFETLGIPMVQGRGISQQDQADTLPALVVNQTMAEKLWPGQDALGQQVRFGDRPDVDVTVVGVARDARYVTLGEAPEPYMYLPLEQRFAAGMTLYARTSGDPRQVLERVQETVQALDPNLPLVGVETGQDILTEALWGPRTGATLLSIYGVLTLLLSAVGVYGVIAYRVAQRRREIGIRLALGSSRLSIFAALLRHGLILALVGSAVGLVLAVASSRLITSLIFGISAADPLTLVASILLLVLVAALASYLPAWRATRTDPVSALRAE